MIEADVARCPDVLTESDCGVSEVLVRPYSVSSRPITDPTAANDVIAFTWAGANPAVDASSPSTVTPAPLLTAQLSQVRPGLPL